MCEPRSEPRKLVILTGATGYVGGRLLPALIDAGYRVRCLVRDTESVTARLKPEWQQEGQVEVCQADVLDPGTLESGLQGGAVAFYMVHSMGSQNGFVDRDREGASNFGLAARNAGIGRVIYLGGLGAGSELSPHLASRHEVGSILGESGVPTIEFRASIIIGSGSLSFEMIRSLVRKLPVMVAPRWVRSQSQPIAIEDVISYLLAAVELPLTRNAIYEIGGPEQVSYQYLMQEFARQRGFKRWILPVPFLTPNLSSKWLGLVTPLYARVGRKLIDSVRHDTVVHDQTALRDFPDITPHSVSNSIALALREDSLGGDAPMWSDPLSAGGEPPDHSTSVFRKRLTDVRKAHVPVPPERAFAPIQQIGGKNGWYFADWLWRVRGFLDLMVGGVGLRRGRPHPTRINVGQPLDFWRVEAFDPPQLLRLRAEMKVPGRAWLQFEVSRDPAGDGALITQTASFDPLGLWGSLYWHMLAPIHQFMFSGMINKISRLAASDSTERNP